MVNVKSIGAALVVVLALSAAVGAFGELPSRKMNLTFSGAVRLPGRTLPAGTYTFERVETGSRLDLVRVTSSNHATVMFMGFTNMIQRPRSAGKQSVTFREAKPGAAPELAAWYPTGETMGHQFVY
jgi:hypothetical protein